MIKDLNVDDFVAGVRALARTSRLVSRGKGVGIRQLYPALQKAYRNIDKKRAKNKPLMESERWYYENLYHVKRYIDNFNSKVFLGLPYVKNEIRVLVFARFIVENSKNGLNYSRIKTAVDTYNRESQLTLAEILALPDAIKFVLTEHVYILAKRFKHADKMRKYGSNGVVDTKLFDSDIYLNTALKSHARDAILRELLNFQIDESAIKINYAMSVAETTKIASFLFESMREVTRTLTHAKLLPLVIIDRQLVAEITDYDKMSMNTRFIYLQRIADIAEKLNASEMLVTTKLIKIAEYNSKDIGVILCEHTSALCNNIKYGIKLKLFKPKGYVKNEWCYIAIEWLATIALSIASSFVFDSWWVGFVSAAPIFMLVDCILNNFLNDNVAKRPLFCMNRTNVPAELATMVVVSEYISSEAAMIKAIEHIRVIQAVNDDPNITVALLVDLKQADSATILEDSAILAAAKQVENENNIVIYIRKRREIGGKFVAYERKRGAIMALVRHAQTGITEDFLYISHNTHHSPKYMLTLDADNVTNINGVRDAVNIISHPANSQFDLISLRARTNNYSLLTKYSRFMSEDCGFEAYPNYSGLYYTLFKRDVYCGKGIFNVSEFYKKLSDIIPQNKVLSHDILEGAILETTSASVVYEDAPRNFVSDMERKRRWGRGDVQLLPFLSHSWVCDNGVKYKSEISPIYRQIMVKNVLNLVAPLAILIIGIASLVVGSGIAVLFLALTCGGLVVSLVENLRRTILQAERWHYFFKRAISYILHTAYNIIKIPYDALNGLCIIIGTLLKMIAKGDMLQWKPYSDSQSHSGKFINEVGLSLLVVPIVGSILLLNGIVSYILISFWVVQILATLALYYSGIEHKECVFSEIDKEKLRSYAENTYEYFRFMRNNSGIIADNLQIKPYKGQSTYTSPTNIGFQLIADLSAYYLGIIKKEEFISSASATINTIEKLEKWHGNLYNWYDVNTLKPTSMYVSSVDSGNLLACLTALVESLKECKEYAIVKKINKIIDECDLSAFLDRETNLFYLGYDAINESFAGHYDLMASESRLMSLIYIAKTGEDAHWRALGRDFTSKKGNTLLSWSGTMFEYLMPELFINAPKYSLIGKSVRNAVAIQMSERTQGVFGRSESGYYQFDNSLSYQYKAFGCKALALSGAEQKDIISPYSSAMMLMYKDKKVVENLKRLEEVGCKENGFIEAVDFEGEVRVVDQYMTHHQGMIMASLLQALCDCKLNKLMLKNSKIKGVSVLLTESMLENRSSVLNGYKSTKIDKINNKYYNNIQNLEYSTQGAGLSEVGLKAFYDPYGGGYLMYGDIIINRFIRGC
ncbi:MAG: glucoamylase family protein, partial [Bacillota bacterium]